MGVLKQMCTAHLRFGRASDAARSVVGAGEVPTFIAEEQATASHVVVPRA